jgi:hypothetical protein
MCQKASVYAIATRAFYYHSKPIKIGDTVHLTADDYPKYLGYGIIEPMPIVKEAKVSKRKTKELKR